MQDIDFVRWDIIPNVKHTMIIQSVDVSQDTNSPQGLHSVLSSPLGSSLLVNPCPTGPTGPPGLQGSKGAPGRVDNDIIFDRLSILVSTEGSDVDFEIGNISKPCRTIQVAIDNLGDGSTVHVVPGDYEPFNLTDRSDFCIRGWGEVSIMGPCLVSPVGAVVLERLNFRERLTLTQGTVAVRSCEISTLDVSSSLDAYIRGCTFTGGTGQYITGFGSNRCIVQGCLFIGAAVNDIIAVSNQGIIFRDNLVRWDSVTNFVSTNVPSPSMIVSHNGIHVVNSTNVTLGTGDVEGVTIHHNSFHNLTPSDTMSYINVEKKFNNVLRMRYTNPGNMIGNMNWGKVMTGHARRVDTVTSGTYTITIATVIYVTGTNVTINMPPPVDGLIVEIATAPGASGTINSPEGSAYFPWTVPSTSEPLASNAFHKLQWSDSKSFWIILFGSISVP